MQAKLVVNAPGDEYEREADRVADAVIRGPAMRLEETPGAELSPVAMTKPAAIQGSDGGFPAAEEFAHQLHASQGQGRPLPPALRETFETKMGADFSGVRIHSGEQASRLSHDIQAKAFTHGSDIFIGAGNYAPGTAAGQRLLAHELAHVAQQNVGATSGVIQRLPGPNQVQIALGEPKKGPSQSTKYKPVLEALKTYYKIVSDNKVSQGGLEGLMNCYDQVERAATAYVNAKEPLPDENTKSTSILPSKKKN